MPLPLANIRVLMIQADAVMGAALGEVFAEQGAIVHASTERLADPEAAARGRHRIDRPA
jgi:hypothetical protein